MLLFIRVLATGPGYATQCKFVSILCSCVVILIIIIFVLDICIIYLFSVESHLHIFTGSARVFVYSVFRGVLNRVYGILQLKYGYSVYHSL